MGTTIAILVGFLLSILLPFFMLRTEKQDRARARRMAEHRMNARLVRATQPMTLSLMPGPEALLRTAWRLHFGPKNICREKHRGAQNKAADLDC